ncbi:toxin-antitoxin system HicB family antitoxin [Dehalobacterium formicoaceticum]|uniref:Toxin-antitoxin system HicB family antitoxin n=1 Tax=Dehalobacterium formicoaceticum TaxID=51515 RepID=A0ABT1Y4Q4_9FIRM|nr:toxin-antitoxin system HicB family antitoxin [Dehalobacterium formicoaceticum]MCR6545476.1 toxin-antitoxin system HicB family antitoxin [Dehalobacterium formicoaceticum]
MAQKKSFLLRIDPALYNALEGWAADELRSVNAHMEYLLRTALIKSGRLPKKNLTEAEEKES